METDIGEFTQQSQRPLEQDDEYQQYGGGPQSGHSQFQQQYYQQPQAPMAPSREKIDIFAELGKTAYIIIFVAFILGFFMGKTMQPVILRPN